jgi:hypothetical protein
VKAEEEKQIKLSFYEKHIHIRAKKYSFAKATMSYACNVITFGHHLFGVRLAYLGGLTFFVGIVSQYERRQLNTRILKSI